MKPSPAFTLLQAAGVLPVVTVDDTTHAIGIAEALVEGGLFNMEVTLRSRNALRAIAMIRREVPAMMVGAGTVLEVRQIQSAQDAGAQFLVTPGTPPALADALMGATVPVIPGAATATELIALAACGFDAAKLFPAEPLGGLSMVASLRGPLPNMGLCPSGGIVEVQLADYLALPNVLCVGGSWLVRDESIAGGDYASVRDAALRATEVLVQARPAD